MQNTLDLSTKKLIINFQRTEVAEYIVYKKIAAFVKHAENKRILEQIADDEQRHATIWRQYSQTDVRPKKLMAAFYPVLAKILGVTFAIKLMERGEEKAQAGYARVVSVFPETKKIFEDEVKHEKQLIKIIREEKLNYLGSIVLGFSDALVELTGALAGLSFALQNTKLIALAGTITGIAASLSMAGSEYLSKKTEKEKQSVRAALYTGAAYITTVILLVLPFILLNDYRIALPITLVIGICIIAAFTFFSAIIEDQKFSKKFFEMASITMSVAALSFLIGYALRQIVGVDI